MLSSWWGGSPGPGAPLGTGALVPLFARSIQRLRDRGRPTRASAADQGVRPTIHKGDAKQAA
jgi:hypothetical protein